MVSGARCDLLLLYQSNEHQGGGSMPEYVVRVHFCLSLERNLGCNGFFFVLNHNKIPSQVELSMFQRTNEFLRIFRQSGVPTGAPRAHLRLGDFELYVML
jgi:hypothetical protein